MNIITRFRISNFSNA